MVKRMLVAAVAALALLLVPPPALSGQQLSDQTRVAPTNDLPNPYARVQPWGELPDGAYAERASFIGAEEGPDGSIYLLSRCRGNSCAGRPEPPVTKHDASGRLLASWGAGMMDFPHGFAVDAEGNVWASDQRTHQVYKWSPSGALLMTIGERGVAGDPPLLDEPTDVAIAPNGDVFVTEGHSFSQGANRVSKFAADGTFLTSWGHTGSGAGEFNVPHTVALDSRGRVFVGDRGNNRIQIFDQAGSLLDVWYQFGRPSGIAIGPDDRIYVADSESWGTDNPGWKKGIRVGSARDGSVHYLIEDIESTTIEHSGAEGVGVDRDGHVFGAVVRRRMLEKHVPGTGGSGPSETFAGAAAMGSPLGHLAHGSPATPAVRSLTATATTEAGVALLHANFAAGDLSDLASMQLHAAHVLHALQPAPGSGGPGTGFGLVHWLELIVEQAQAAAGAPDASSSLRTHAGHVALIAEAVSARARRAADVARQLSTATSMRVASPLVAELRLLVYRIAEGGDEDGDGSLALDGEAGLQQLEAHVYLALEGEGLSRIIR